METFALIVGHLLGDYVFQDDEQALNKQNKYPAWTPPPYDAATMPGVKEAFVGAMDSRRLTHVAHRTQTSAARRGRWLCLLHCLYYTACVYACCFWFLSPWCYPLIFLTHYPVDRWGLARKFMRWNGQEKFATGPCSPWSIIAVDQCSHMLVLLLCGCFSLYWK